MKYFEKAAARNGKYEVGGSATDAMLDRERGRRRRIGCRSLVSES